MKEQYQKIVEYIKKNLSCDDYKIIISSDDTINTRFGNNGITQNMAGETTNLRLQVFFGSRSGEGSTTSFDQESIDKLIKDAEETAKLSAEDPEFMPTVGQVELAKTNNFCEDTYNLSEAEITSNVEKTVAKAKSLDAKVAGLATKYYSNSYMETKNGFKGYDSDTLYMQSMTLTKGKKETKVLTSVADINDFSIERQVSLMEEQFQALSDPKQSEKGKYNVILRPSAVLNFFSFMSYFMSRRYADLGMTPFKDQIGKKFFGEKFTLRTVVDQANIWAPKFMTSGIIPENINWVKNGVLENLSVDRFYGKQKNLKPNARCNMVIEGEDATIEEMMKKVPNGLIINNFWYIRNVDQRKGELTGLTRDGVNYFENGKIQHSVTNLRFNEIPHEVTRRILALGKSMPLLNSAKIPPMLIEDFTFVDTTNF